MKVNVELKNGQSETIESNGDILASSNSVDIGLTGMVIRSPDKHPVSEACFRTKELKRVEIIYA